MFCLNYCDSMFPTVRFLQYLCLWLLRDSHFMPSALGAN